VSTSIILISLSPDSLPTLKFVGIPVRLRIISPLVLFPLSCRSSDFFFSLKLYFTPLALASRLNFCNYSSNSSYNFFARSSNSGCFSSSNTSSFRFLYFSISKVSSFWRIVRVPTVLRVSPIYYWILIGMYLSIKCSIVISLFFCSSIWSLMSSNILAISKRYSLKFALSYLVSCICRTSCVIFSISTMTAD